MRRKTPWILLFACMFCCLLSGLFSWTAANADAAVPAGKYTQTLTQKLSFDENFSFQIVGASVRKISPVGLRFFTTIEGADLEKLPQDGEFGTLLLPQNLLPEENALLTVQTESALIAKALTVSSSASVPAGGMGYYISLVGKTLEENFPQDLYTTNFVARSYFKYTYTPTGGEEPVEDVLYSKNQEIRSIAYIAACALVDLEQKGTPDADEKSFLNQIIAASANGMRLSLSKSQIRVGESVVATVDGATDGTHTFPYILRSSDENVATVYENTITAVGAGETVISANIGAKTLQITLTVQAITGDGDYSSTLSNFAAANGETLTVVHYAEEGLSPKVSQYGEYGLRIDCNAESETTAVYFYTEEIIRTGTTVSFEIYLPSKFSGYRIAQVFVCADNTMSEGNSILLLSTDAKEWKELKFTIQKTEGNCFYFVLQANTTVYIDNFQFG